VTDPLIGRVLGGTYAIERTLGQGGFGVVYVARHQRTGKSYAVKVLRADRAAASEDVKSRFRREAETLASVGHPGIVAIHDFASTEDGIDYLVMDLLEGEDLAARLSRTDRLPLETALGLIKQLAGALRAAHDKGIVHRDLKPANIFLVTVPGEGERATILDFGLAKMLDEATEARVTASGVAMGTPQYMSPEQAMGVPLSRRTDIYALASIFYEMVSGAPVFVAPTLNALLVKILTAPPPLISTHLPVPAAVEAALDRALAKEPGHRFGSAPEFVAALEGRKVPAGRETRQGLDTPVPMTRALPASTPHGGLPPGAPALGRPSPETPHGWPVQEVTAEEPPRNPGAKVMFAIAAAAVLGALTLVGAGAWFVTSNSGGSDTVVEVTPGPAPEPIAVVAVAPPTMPEPAMDGPSLMPEDDEGLAAEGASQQEAQEAPEAPEPSLPPGPGRQTRPPRTRSSPRPTPAEAASPAAAPAAAPGAAAVPPQVAAALEAAQATYRAQVADYESQLRAIDAFLADVDSLRSMFGGMADGRRPRICDGSGARAMGRGSELGWIVSQQQRVRDQIERLCQPFENLENTPVRVRNDFDRLASTIDRAEQMASNRSIGSNTPADIPDQIVAALQVARREVQGVPEGRRPFPCDAPVFRRLRQLENDSDSYAASGAHQVVSLRDRICRRLGTDVNSLRASEQRFRRTLDDIEGTVRQNRRTMRGLRDRIRSLIQ